MTFDPGLPPERLVLTGLRCWLAGYETGDIGCWELAWNTWSSELGTQGARQAVGELASWVRVLMRGCGRRLQCHPHACPGLCRDECFALGIVAACQHDDRAAARAAAFCLVGETRAPFLDDVVTASDEFAEVLTCCGCRLALPTPRLVARLACQPDSCGARLH